MSRRFWMITRSAANGGVYRAGQLAPQAQHSRNDRGKDRDNGRTESEVRLMREQARIHSIVEVARMWNAPKGRIQRVVDGTNYAWVV